MLAEWLERWWTSCPLYLQDMGCLREMLGLRRRWRRYRHEWEFHVHLCREAVVAAIERCEQRRKAVVLGSGWLHDVYLEELAWEFDEVTLVDLFHPLSVRWHARRYANVRLLAHDVTETLQEVWRIADQPETALPCVRPTLFREDCELDLTISLNLLSQLPCLPESYLRRIGAHSTEAIVGYCRQLIQAHVEYLRSLPGVVTLVTDIRVTTLGGSKDTLFGVTLPWVGTEWDWDLVPDSEVLTVTCVVNVNEADLGTP